VREKDTSSTPYAADVRTLLTQASFKPGHPKRAKS